MTGASVILVTGAGGVGKTTIAAAAGVSAARAGVRTLVMTVDPARRLADALGVGLGNLPSEVDHEKNLWAAMLDITASWEAIVARHAEPEVGDRLLENPFFRAIADRFPAAQAYAAGEQMAEFVDSGMWDLVIVDTPPAAGGVDFLVAPGRTIDLVGGKLLRWLTGAQLPGRRALYRVTARPVLRLADAVLGGPLLEEVAEFLLDLRTLYDGMAARAKGVERYLRAATTVVVTNASPTPMREARRFFEELPAEEIVPAAVIFNRDLPHEWEHLEEVADNSTELDRQTWAALRDNLLRWAAEARRTADARTEFAARYEAALASVPWMSQPPTDTNALAELVDRSQGLRKALFG